MCSYLFLKTMVPMKIVGFRRQKQATPQIQLVCALLSVQIRDAVTKQDHSAQAFFEGVLRFSALSSNLHLLR